eukprot:TRINITY_DN7665_c0_g1_i2.p1 TRINITY_DN7665_c0_g1~~TRINITY_DN7665_c0_g1_i2.p1  ORF type:complete len:393 (+),score=109.81 TRINITY_DN7665_c0_g1_i2:62-1180(+)
MAGAGRDKVAALWEELAGGGETVTEGQFRAMLSRLRSEEAAGWVFAELADAESLLTCGGFRRMAVVYPILLDGLVRRSAEQAAGRQQEQRLAAGRGRLQARQRSEATKRQLEAAHSSTLAAKTELEVALAQYGQQRSEEEQRRGSVQGVSAEQRRCAAAAAADEERARQRCTHLEQQLAAARQELESYAARASQQRALLAQAEADMTNALNRDGFLDRCRTAEARVTAAEVSLRRLREAEAEAAAAHEAATADNVLLLDVEAEEVEEPAPCEDRAARLRREEGEAVLMQQEVLLRHRRRHLEHDEAALQHDASRAANTNTPPAMAGVSVHTSPSKPAPLPRRDIDGRQRVSDAASEPFSLTEVSSSAAPLLP